MGVGYWGWAIRYGGRLWEVGYLGVGYWGGYSVEIENHVFELWVCLSNTITKTDTGLNWV